MARIARLEPFQREQDEQIRGVELRIPRRLAANPRAEPQIALEQRRNACTSAITGDAGERSARDDAILDRSKVMRSDGRIHRKRVGSTIFHADARAAEKMPHALRAYEGCDAGPEEHDRSAAAVVARDASAAPPSRALTPQP